MQGVKFKYSVDALKVCYKLTLDLYTTLTSNPIKEQCFIFKSPDYKDDLVEDFRLQRIKIEEREFEILIPDTEKIGEFSKYGYLEIKPKEDTKFAGMCFITLDNRRLYEPFAVWHEVLTYKKVKNSEPFDFTLPMSEYIKHMPKKVPASTKRIQYNSIGFLEEMASRLGLTLNSISNLEIALDSNINFAKIIKNTVANDDYVPVINKRKYPDIDSRNTLNNTHLQYSTTRKRAVNLSYLIKQSNGNLQLKCYNKSREIEEKSKKTYIYTWLGMDKNIHRMEITAKWQKIKEYLEAQSITKEFFLYNLHTGENLSEPFERWLNTLIHFKKAGKNKGSISLFELVVLNREK